MDIANMQIVVPVAVFLLLAALFIIIKSFALPKSYYKNEKARSEIRMRLREKEYEAKQEKNEIPPVNETTDGKKQAMR